MNTYTKYCPNVFVAACDEQHGRGDIIEMTTSRGKTHDCEVWNFLGQKSDGKYLYSITRCDGTNRQTRAAARAQKYEDWAASAHDRSNAAFQRSEDAVAGIPFGQPILVGHHSESRHRNALKRSDAAMRKCVEESDKAESHEHKAEYWERQSEVIDLSMPESLEYFKEQLEKAEEYHAGVKSGKYPRQHAYTLTYAKKAVNELRDKVNTAKKLWGEPEGTTPAPDTAPNDQKTNPEPQPEPAQPDTQEPKSTPDPDSQKNIVTLQNNNESKKQKNTMSNRQLASDQLVRYLTDQKLHEYIEASHLYCIAKWLICKPDGTLRESISPDATKKAILLEIATPHSYQCDCELCAPFKYLRRVEADKMTPEQVEEFEREYGITPADIQGRSIVDLYNPEALADLMQDYRDRASQALAAIPQGYFDDEK